MTWQSKKLRELVRDFPCQHCGAEDGTIVACHSNQLRDGKGMGLKTPDYRIAALCYACHTELDNGMLWSRAERIDIWEEAHRATIGLLFERNLIGVLK